jgi:hypothetical protein
MIPTGVRPSAAAPAGRSAPPEEEMYLAAARSRRMCGAQELDIVRGGLFGGAAIGFARDTEIGLVPPWLPDLTTNQREL